MWHCFPSGYSRIVAAAEEMFTTAAAFDARSAGRTAFVRRIAAKRLSAKASCHSLSGIVHDPARNARAPNPLTVAPNGGSKVRRAVDAADAAQIARYAIASPMMRTRRPSPAFYF